MSKRAPSHTSIPRAAELQLSAARGPGTPPVELSPEATAIYNGLVMSIDGDNRHRLPVKHQAAALSNILVEIDRLNRVMRSAMESAEGDELIEILKDLKQITDMRNKNVTAATTLIVKLGLSMATTGERANRTQRLRAEKKVAMPVDDFGAVTPGNNGNWADMVKNLRA